MIQHNGKLVLGVDMGNYNMKTAHNCFPSAYMELAGDGNNYRHTLRCGGKVYALGGKRVAQRDDKASMNDDFLILTQFAIAMELEACRLGAGTYDISLATALPPAYLTSREMRSNLKQFFRRQMDFRYNGRRYRVNISKVYVCPQGIAAAYAGVRTEEMERRNTAFASPMELLSKEAISVLVDIGGGTVDPVVLKYGLPQPMEDENPAKGIIWTYSNIRRDIKAKTGQDISEEAVNMVLNGRTGPHGQYQPGDHPGPYGQLRQPPADGAAGKGPSLLHRLYHRSGRRGRFCQKPVEEARYLCGAGLPAGDPGHRHGL